MFVCRYSTISVNMREKCRDDSESSKRKLSGSNQSSDRNQRYFVMCNYFIIYDLLAVTLFVLHVI